MIKAMGWDGIRQDRRKTNEELIQFIRSEMNGQYELLDYHITKEAVYVSFRSPLTGNTFGTVILVRNNASELMLKWMHEDEGPHYFDCPVRIINQLTPTSNEYANTWRQHCKRENIHKAKETPSNQSQLLF